MADAFTSFARYDEAAAALRKSAQLAPKSLRDGVYAQWALFFERKGDLRQAERWYLRAARLRPTPHILIQLGEVLITEGRFSEAKLHLDRANQLEASNRNRVCFNLGLILRARRKYKEAQDRFAEALTLDPDNLLTKDALRDTRRAFKVRSRIQSQKRVSSTHLWQELVRSDRSPASQREIARRYVQRCPHEAHGWILLADALANLRLYAEGEQALHRAAAVVKPDETWRVATEWGHIHKEADNLRQAESWYRIALGLNPGPFTHVFLGACLARMGRHSEAKRHHRRAIQLKNRGSAVDEAYLNLGLVLRAEQKYPEALDCFRKALRLDPGYQDAKDARDDVRQALKLRK